LSAEHAVASPRLWRAFLGASALVLALLAIGLAGNAPEAKAANGTCEVGQCTWNCNPQAATSWCWFDAVGGNNARTWYYNSARDYYANHVWKCAAAIRSDNGETWHSACGSAEIVSNSYLYCPCGGLYVRTWNNASEPRNLYSVGDYG